jgi:enoyl-CoA hydratase
MSGEGIRTSAERDLWIIEIDRPQRRNALDAGAVAGLKSAFAEFSERDDLAVAVLHGRHGSFCAGADLKELAEQPSYEAWAGDLDGMLGAPLPKPMIAAVSGHAVAGGLGLALYCDIRIADATAVFGVFCRRFGVPMSDGSTVRLPGAVGEARALDMMLTGRGVAAEEAKAIGLVSRVVPEGGALSAACDLARQIAAYPPLAMRSDRMSLLESRGSELGPALIAEKRWAEAAKKGEAQAGASRFAGGVGRHGSFSDDD